MRAEIGGKYFARERLAELNPAVAIPEPDLPVLPAVAPLCECAATHYGMTLEAYISLLYDALYGD
jgi:hypothetical protein